MRAFILLLLMSLPAAGFAQDRVPAHPHIRIDTSEGTILLELDGRRAPLTVANFLSLVESGYYEGTIFHRVIPGFMAQAGGFTPNLKSKEPEGGIPNESGNGLRNMRGTIAMARTRDPHSGNAQFYINVADNRSLDPRPDSWGYAVFGYVMEGMDVVDKIVSVQTGPAGRFSSDVPVVPIIINEVSLVVYDD